MDNFNKLLKLEEGDFVEIIVKNISTDEDYLCNTTIGEKVALFNIHAFDDSKDLLITKEDFNNNYVYVEGEI